MRNSKEPAPGGVTARNWLICLSTSANPIRDGAALVLGAALLANLLTGPSALVTTIEHAIGHSLVGWQIAGACAGLFFAFIDSASAGALYRDQLHARQFQASHICRAFIAWPLIWQALLPALWAILVFSVLVARKIMDNGASAAAIAVLVFVGVATLAALSFAHMTLRRSILRRLHNR